MKGFFTPLFKIVTAPIKLTVIILRRMSAAILKIVPAIVGLAGRILSPLGKIIYDNVATKIIDLGNKLYKPILHLLAPIQNLFSPLRNLPAKFGTYLSHHLGVLWGKISGLLFEKFYKRGKERSSKCW